MATHESTVSHRKVLVGSERNFGLVFAGVFTLIGLAPLTHGGAVRWWAIAIAAVFVALGFIAPSVLKPLNRLWLKLGLVLHHVVNPVVMGLVYYCAVVPTALVLKARGKKLLRLKRDPVAKTYWIERAPPGPAPGSMSKQF